MKSILLPLTEPETDKWVAEKAVDVSVDLNAHLTALLIDPVVLTVPVYPHYGGMTHYPLLLQQLRDESSARQAKLKSLLQDAVSKKGVAFGPDLPAPSAELAHTDGDAWTAVQEQSPVHDAILFVRRAAPGEAFETSELLKDALEYSGRPVLILTDSTTPKLATRVGIAWNGSVESARAVAAALPILARAEEVIIFTFASNKTDVAEAERLRSYLGHHQVSAALQTSSAEGPIGEALLASAHRSAVTLLITGGYTHSRLRQAVFGGVTRHLLAHSRIPMLMAH